MASARDMIGRTEKAAQQERKRTTTVAEQEAKRQLRAQQALTTASDSLDRQRSRGLFTQYRAQEAASERAAKTQERAATRAHNAERREIEKNAKAIAKAAEKERKDRERNDRAVVRRAVRQGESFAQRTSHRATRFLQSESPLGPMVMRGLGSVVQGAGVDLSVQGGIRRSVDLQTEATQLANQQRIATGKTDGAKSFVALARRVGDQTSSDPGSALALASRFAAKTGKFDFEDIVPQLASLARASGASFDDVGSSAGSIFQQLRSGPDAAAKTIEVMRSIIGQSAEGAVDMPDYASQLSRVAAGAFKFTGDRGKNISALSALTQIAMERGATSAADAARSTGSFVSTLGKGARLAEFDKAGVRTYTSDTVGRDGKVIAGELRTELRPLQDIIKDSFRATGGDIPTLGRMYQDVLGRKGVESLGSEYQAAGGGEAGIKAITDVFDRYMRATITTDVERQNNQDADNTVAARAQRFQNALDKVTDFVLDDLAPPLEKAAPLVLKFVEAMGQAAAWAVENPGKAILTAITLSIARAGLESTLRSGIERVLLGATNASGVGTRAAAVGSIASAAGLGLSLAAIAVTSLVVGKATIDFLTAKLDAEQDKAVGKGIDATNAQGVVHKLLSEGKLEEAKKAQQEAIALKQSEIAATEEQKPGFWMKAIDMTMTNADQQEVIKSRDAAVERAMQQQLKELADQNNLLARIAEAVERQPGGNADTSGTGRRVSEFE